jgi:HAE1 family hydrophobic/amphiphilic exporter-1
MKRFVIACLSAGLLCGAQEAPPRTGVGMVQRKLTLKDAIALAVANNLDIEIRRADTASAAAAVRGARGFFDPTFRWLPLVESRNTPAGSVLQAATGKLSENFLTQNVYYNQRLPWKGSAFQASFENTRQTSSNPFVTLDPLYSSRLILSFTHPLLRGRDIDPQRAELEIRRKQQDLSETELRLKTIDIVTAVEQGYWALVSARQDAEVRFDTVEWAKEQLARNRRMIDAGTLAPVELAASEAELQRRMDTWYASLQGITEAENTLKTLVAADRQDPIWGEEIVPTEVATLEGPATDDLRALSEQALRERIELQATDTQREINDVQRRQAADQVKPQVNLVASYVSSGLAGTVRAGDNPFSASNTALYQRLNQLSAQAGLAPLPPPSFGSLPDRLVGGYGSTLANLFAGRYQSVQAGLQIDFTFHNNAAEAALAQTAIADRRIKLQRAQLSQAIEAQVRNAVQAMQTAHQRIAAAEASVRAAKEKLDSETRLFQTGESTNFLVLTRQNEYTDSRHRLLVAQLDRNRAVSRLDQALGATLSRHGIKVK